MVIKRSVSQDADRLVDALTDVDPVASETAAARLTILGPRVVQRILRALAAAAEPRQAVALLSVLERIGDVRALAPAARTVSDADATVAIAAIGAVRPHLVSDDVDVATRALQVLTDVAMDRARAAAVRAAAIEALEDLPPSVTEPLRARWSADTDPAIRRRSDRGAGSGDATVPSLDELLEADLGDDPDAARAVITANAADAPLSLLHHAVTAAATREAASAGDARIAWRIVRALAHHGLAGRASRVALYDLREMVATSDALPVGAIQAMAEIGDRSCLDALGEAWNRTSDQWVRDHLAQALSHILVREGLSRRHDVVKRLARHAPALLDAALSKPSRTAR